jgi:glycerol-3-phosphate dehydrogenase
MIATEPQRRLDNLKRHYDLAVVGGGIYGATVAWEAASRGLDVVPENDSWGVAVVAAA